MFWINSPYETKDFVGIKSDPSVCLETRLRFAASHRSSNRISGMSCDFCFEQPALGYFRIFRNCLSSIHGSNVIPTISVLINDSLIFRLAPPSKIKHEKFGRSVRSVGKAFVVDVVLTSKQWRLNSWQTQTCYPCLIFWEIIDFDFTRNSGYARADCFCPVGKEINRHC